MRAAPVQMLALALAVLASATEEYRVCRKDEVGTVMRRLRSDTNGEADGKYYHMLAEGWYYDEYYDMYFNSIDEEEGVDQITENLVLAKGGGGSPFNMAQEPGPYAIYWNRYPTPSPMGTAWAFNQTLATCPEQIPLTTWQGIMHSCLTEIHSDENYYDGYWSDSDTSDFGVTNQTEAAMKILVPGVCYYEEDLMGTPLVVYSTEDKLFFDLTLRAHCLWVSPNGRAQYQYVPSLFSAEELAYIEDYFSGTETYEGCQQLQPILGHWLGYQSIPPLRHRLCGMRHAFRNRRE